MSGLEKSSNSWKLSGFKMEPKNCHKEMLLAFPAFETLFFPLLLPTVEVPAVFILGDSIRIS